LAHHPGLSEKSDLFFYKIIDYTYTIINNIEAREILLVCVKRVTERTNTTVVKPQPIETRMPSSL